MASTFNVLGRAVEELNRVAVPVWLGKVRPVPVGGVFASSAIVAGRLYSAGAPINIASKVITPAFIGKVTAKSTGVLTVVFDQADLVPTTSDKINSLSSAGALGTAAAITAVAANATAGYDLTTSFSANVGDTLILGIGGNPVAPNAYLYNDVKIAAATDQATGAAVQFHGEGILIDRTPSAGIAAAMKVLVPGVLQVND